jgi:acyl-CoA synthetase (AMP-forming)/AMP-acid ligase II
VAPIQVEAVVADHPAVADVADVGLPHVQWGEVICAVLVVRPDHQAPTVEELRSHCQGRLASFKHPRQIAVVEEIPRTLSTQQVQRRLLVELLTIGSADPK